MLEDAIIWCDDEGAVAHQKHRAQKIGNRSSNSDQSFTRKNGVEVYLQSAERAAETKSCTSTKNVTMVVQPFLA